MVLSTKIEEAYVLHSSKSTPKYIAWRDSCAVCTSEDTYKNVLSNVFILAKKNNPGIHSREKKVWDFHTTECMKKGMINTFQENGYIWVSGIEAPRGLQRYWLYLCFQLSSGYLSVYCCSLNYSYPSHECFV